MIYISLAYSGNSNLKESLEILYENGFKHIELSGGFEYYEGLVNDLLVLQTRHNLYYICHSCFPPPKESFVLNLASQNENIYKKTVSHLKESISLSKKLKATKVGFHAGFFIDISNDELGRDLRGRKLFDKKKSMARFCEGFNELTKAAGSLELYIENNVLSNANLHAFGNENPLMLTSYRDYVDLKEKIVFKLLLDVGHLKVSATSLGLDFEDELEKMTAVSDYLHCSDNDGFSDENKAFFADSELYRQLQKYNLSNKTVTLEVKGGIERIKNCYNLLMKTR